MNVHCISWLFRYVDRVDIVVLKEYFTTCLDKNLKKEIELAYTIKNIFVENMDNKQNEFKLNKRCIPNKAVYIDCLALDTLQYKCIVKVILKSLY